MKKPIAIREQVIVSLVKQELNNDEAAKLLGCTKRTIRTYLRLYLIYGVKGLVDHRKSNNHKLTEKERDTIITLKRSDRWRSPRNIRDHLDV